MEHFHIIEGVKCILRSKGVFRQCDLYRNSGELYAEWGRGGFVKLMRAGGTSSPHVSWDAVDEGALESRGWRIPENQPKVGALKLAQIEKMKQVRRA